MFGTSLSPCEPQCVEAVNSGNALTTMSFDGSVANHKSTFRRSPHSRSHCAHFRLFFFVAFGASNDEIRVMGRFWQRMEPMQNSIMFCAKNSIYNNLFARQISSNCEYFPSALFERSNASSHPSIYCPHPDTRHQTQSKCRTMALSVAENLLICVWDNWNNVSKVIKAMTDVVKNNRKKERSQLANEVKRDDLSHRRNPKIVNVLNDGGGDES